MRSTGVEQSTVSSAHGWESALMAAEKNGGNTYEFATAKCSKNTEAAADDAEAAADDTEAVTDDTEATADHCIFASPPRSASQWKTVPPQQV